MFDLSIIKVALEYAQFQDYRVRDTITDLVRNLEADMDEVGFEASPKTKKCIEEFETLITDIETARKPKSPRFEIQENDEPVREVKHVPSDEELDVHRVKNVDDELEDYLNSTTKK
jgi:hypothetical protein